MARPAVTSAAVLNIDQINASRAELTITNPTLSDVNTLELHAARWWYLVRALVPGRLDDLHR